MKKPRGLLFDMVQCQGCYSCVKACMEIHDFEGDPEQVTDLSATAYTSLVIVDDYPIRNLCRHCITPSCASVCPVAALHKTDLGPVVYDVSRCIGCRYCIMACPFNIPRYEWHKPVPAVRKCDMCIDRLERGQPTACAEACPFDATVVGTREELLAEARRRIKENPDDYYPHIYGEHEVGGTSVLFLAPHAVASLGYDEALGTEPLPDLTWKVLSKIPGITIGGAAALLAFWWITHRRNEVAVAEAEAHAAPAQEKEETHGQP
ncbi:MAG: 4Fe-4S dicluster domain-containing protein [Planctomycetota bacterium]|jgi:formate dehydrogenase iron-sulfur subunit